MKVYICYDRYERDEWYSVEYIGTDRDESIKKVKEEILPDFLCYGPDDCHSFQLQVVEMSKKDYNQLLKWDSDPSQKLENYGTGNSDYFEFMCQLYDLTGEYDCCLISTDGCSDFYEMIKYYGQMKGIDPEDFEDYEDELQEEFCSMDDKECREIIKKYVQETY